MAAMKTTLDIHDELLYAHRREAQIVQQRVQALLGGALLMGSPEGMALFPWDHAGIRQPMAKAPTSHRGLGDQRSETSTSPPDEVTGRNPPHRR